MWDWKGYGSDKAKWLIEDPTSRDIVKTWPMNLSGCFERVMPEKFWQILGLLTAQHAIKQLLTHPGPITAAFYVIKPCPSKRR